MTIEFLCIIFRALFGNKSGMGYLFGAPRFLFERAEEEKRKSEEEKKELEKKLEEMRREKMT
ncbi:MAG: hypothetical protein ONB13_06215, partial [candidate division KSB1 bacterium]|nr:hypothetical protein [candidate division KSB1 bacterium]